MVVAGQACGPSPRQVREAFGRGAMGPSFGRGSGDSVLPRKAAALGGRPPVPQNGPGGLEEDSEAFERILVKELGKSLPYLRYKGARVRSSVLAAAGGVRGHMPGGSDCLLKTQVRAKTQVAVYALTPARCRKVKRIRHGLRIGSGEVKPR